MPETAENEFSLKGFFLPFTTFKAINLLIFLGIVVYANSLFGDFVGDDTALIVNNLLTHSLGDAIKNF